MGAVVLLDSIINETIKNFRGHEVLESSLGFQRLGAPANLSAVMGPGGATSGAGAPPAAGPTESASVLDQLDSLTSLMQEIEIGRNERIFWILLFLLMVLVAAGGNVIVIYIVSTNKEMKSVTNYFLVNLSLADTMVSTLNVIFNFISMLNSHWPFGKIYCKISNFIAILSISASVFTLTAISCDRYNAIIYPLRPRMSRKHAIAWILLIWTLSSALAMPNLIYSVVVEDRLVNENLALTCTMIWPDGRYPLSSYDHIYNIIILVVTYLVPILTMAILYYEVGKELWGYEAIGENIEKQRRAIMAKKKIVKMMIVVVIMFALCWLPYHGFFIVNYYLPTIFQDGPLLYQRCYLIIYWLAMSNSMYNPIIIYFMNSKFRHEFRRVLWFICCCRTYVPPIKTESMISNNHNHNNNNNNSTAACNTTTASHGGNGSRRSRSRNSRDQTAAGFAIDDMPTPTPTSTTTNITPSSRRSQHKQTTTSNQLLAAGSASKSMTSVVIPIEVIITQSSDHESSASVATNHETQHSSPERLMDEQSQEQVPFLDQQRQACHQQRYQNQNGVCNPTPGGYCNSIDLITSRTSGDQFAKLINNGAPGAKQVDDAKRAPSSSGVDAAKVWI